jgi:hypothetical protein
MRAILRNRNTGLYYAECNRWVPDPDRALDFDEIEHPGLLVFEEGATELEVVVSFEDSDCELVMPVRLEWYAGQVTRVAA